MHTSDRTWRTSAGPIPLDGPTLVMAVVNVTPDSFSDGGRYLSTGAAVDHAHALIAEGADILDVGGESTRPGADVVALGDELARVVPVIERLSGVGVPISVDTTKPEVAEAAIDAGASIVNDVSGVSDQAMVELVARTGVGVVVMHMAGTPATMQDGPAYDDVVAEVADYLSGRVEALVASGVHPDAICVDPGIGFGKATEHNLDLLANVDRFRGIGRALMVGTSRKRYLAQLTGRERPLDRDAATAATTALAVLAGVDVVRVHNVAFSVDARQVADAMVSFRRLR